MLHRSFIKNTSLTTLALAAGTSFVYNQIPAIPCPAGGVLTCLIFIRPTRHTIITQPKKIILNGCETGALIYSNSDGLSCYLNIDRTKNITPDDVYKINNEAVDDIDSLVQMAHQYNMHTSINLHRAPGYCVNAGFNEPFNLWKDEAAQNAFYFHWEYVGKTI